MIMEFTILKLNIFLMKINGKCYIQLKKTLLKINNQEQELQNYIGL